MRLWKTVGRLTKSSRTFEPISITPLSFRRPASQLRSYSTQLGGMSVPYTVPPPGGIPENHKPHTESKTTILLPSAGAFLNPPQQFNRDLSVAVIRAWNERRKEVLEERFRARMERGKGKKKKGKGREDTGAAPNPEELSVNGATIEESVAGPSTKPFRPPKITIIEALSATGLRSIRYAKEIPDVKYVLANDLSPSACEAMRMNVAFNGVAEDSESAGPSEAPHHAGLDEGAIMEPLEAAEHGEVKVNGSAKKPDVGRRPGCDGVVKVTEGDACALMSAHRLAPKRVDVVDLDPYGTAAPFIDSAVNAVADGGLLCVTCTDTAVFAGNAYPEKSFSNYGGACVNAEYRHEVGLRLILNSVATAAARYGRYITPLLSFSIDFYARLFIVVTTGAAQVKDLATNTGLVYYCNHCSTSTIQPFGRTIEKENSAGHMIKDYKLPQRTIHGEGCEECGLKQNVGGPMWLGPIQDPAFARRCLDSIEGDKEHYGTWPRMHGHFTLAEQELSDPFYFTLNRIASHFHSSAPPSNIAINALLNAGYNVSRSHAMAGSLKTNAPWSFIYDIMREHIKTVPVRMDKLSENSPARGLLAKSQTHDINLSKHPDAYKLDKAQKVVFYQENPTENWGPASRAKSFRTSKAAPQGPLADDEERPTDAEAAHGTEDGPESQKRKNDGDDPEADAKRTRMDGA